LCRDAGFAANAVSAAEFLAARKPGNHAPQYAEFRAVLAEQNDELPVINFNGVFYGEDEFRRTLALPPRANACQNGKCQL
jgi:hypothetical protein